MKTLYPAQEETCDFFVDVIRDGRNSLDSSVMGTGKTVVGARIAKRIIENPFLEEEARRITNVAVICPKAVFPSWETELRECGLEPTFIQNVEKLRLGKTPWVKKVGKKNFKWEIPTDTLVLVDEIHKLKGPWTLNAALLVALVKQGFRIHGMSGTPCENPMEMRPLGYMLRLHTNDHSRGGLPNYWQWLTKLRCTKGFFGGHEMRDVGFALSQLRQTMYGVSTRGLTVADFPDSFRDNRVIVDPIEFSNNEKIVQAYDKLDMDAEEVRDYIERGNVPEHLRGLDEDDRPMIVKILDARIECEKFKVADIAAMAKDAIKEGYNVVVFMNFTKSLHEVSGLLECEYIDGSIAADARNDIIDKFQRDETHCLALNAATGGTGISLHDTVGERPRLSLISPSFNAKEFSQVLGRIHRNGAKSDALQKVLLSDGSIEEYVMEAISKKLHHMNLIHNSQICELNSSYYK
jgi:hypothetical protein